MQTRIVSAMTLAAVLVCSAAHAAEWISLLKTSDDHPTEILIDLSSIALKDGIRTAQTKSVALLPWRDNAQPFNGAAYGIQRRSFDCNAGLVQVGGVELHFAGGATAGFLDVEQRWNAVEDPLTKQMFDLVCGLKDPKPYKTPN